MLAQTRTLISRRNEITKLVTVHERDFGKLTGAWKFDMAVGKAIRGNWRLKMSNGK
jgi:hypothetical protein